MLRASLMALFCLSGPALGQECPPAPDHSAPLSDLLKQIRSAETEREGQALSNQMWEFWADAPDERSQAMLDEGMAARSQYDFLRATQAFDRLIAYCPDYAEGYNQRAFVNFLRQDFAAALVDLDAALERSPDHVAALAGKGLTLAGLGRNAEATIALRKAVSMNPWLSERHLLDQLDPGEDL